MRGSLLVLAIALASAPARADDTAKAKQLYDEGLRHYEIAEYTQAVDAWKQAYLISKKPLLLFNIGQAYRLSGDCEQAMTFYANYQDAEPTPKNQDELDQAIAACKDVKPAEPKPVDDKPIVASPPIAAVIAVEPAHEPSGGHRGLALIVGGAGVAVAGGAVVFALLGRSAENEVEQVTMWDAHASGLQSAGERDNKLAWGLGAAGAAAIITGAVLFVVGGPSTEHVAIVPTQGGARVGWTTSF